jgi:hypothetical protein
MLNMPMVDGSPLQMEMSYIALDAFILFFYRATVNQCILRSHLVELLQAADKYGVGAVKEGVIDYAAKEIDDVSALEGYDTFSKKCPEAVMELYDGVVKRLKRKIPRQEPLSTIQGQPGLLISIFDNEI